MSWKDILLKLFDDSIKNEIIVEDEEVDLDQLEIIKSNIADEEYNELRDLNIADKERR